MSTETTLKGIINAVPEITGGAHYAVNRTGSTDRYVVFHQISELPTVGISQDLGLDNCIYQVDVFAKTPEAAKGLAKGPVKAAILASAELGATYTFGAGGQYFDDDETYQYITEYRIWVKGE